MAIRQRKKAILGIDCKKAYTNSGKVAWYAPSIPYPDGPQYGIFDLPGLVLSYETPNHIWLATEISFDEVDIKLPSEKLVIKNDDIKLSYDELKELKSDKVIVINENSPLNTWVSFKE